jgi:hypothetical protein
MVKPAGSEGLSFIFISRDSPMMKYMCGSFLQGRHNKYLCETIHKVSHSCLFLYDSKIAKHLWRLGTAIRHSLVYPSPSKPEKVP